jgi:hypothetical protein
VNRRAFQFINLGFVDLILFQSTLKLNNNNNVGIV